MFQRISDFLFGAPRKPRSRNTEVPWSLGLEENLRDPAHVECSVECLEERCMLAGNVTAQFKGTDLVITGDGLSNHVVVTNLSNGIRVAGLQDGAGDRHFG